MSNIIKPIKVGIIWANIDSPNLGVSALVYSTLVIFEEISKRTGVRFEYLLWGSKLQNCSIDVNGRNIKIKQVPYFLGGDIIRYIKNLIKRPLVFLNYRYISDLKKCDILVDTGEGDSYADIYGIERFRHFDYIKSKCLNTNRSYILLPQTIGPFNTLEAQRKARQSLNKVSAVIARDFQSYKFCQSLASDSKVLRSIDMAFFLPFNKIKLPESDKIKLGINISGLLWEGGYTQNNQFGLKENYKNLIVEIINNLYQSKLFEIHFVGHVNGEDNEIDDDWHILKHLKDIYPDAILAPKFKSPIDAKSYISSLDCFIGARMHACIAAISSGVPVLPMAYSRKFNGLFIDTLKYPLLIDLTRDNTRESIMKIDDFLLNLESTKKRIQLIQKDIIDIEKDKLISLITKYIV